MTIFSLAEYQVTSERGFLSCFDPQQQVLPPQLQPIRETALALPWLLPTERIRTHVDRLPVLDLRELCADAKSPVLRVAMVHYAFLAQAYVWGEPAVPRSLPACLARPLWALGEATGQPPLLTYAHYVLDNWALIDPHGGFDLSNLRMLQPFLSGQDEAWFVLIHVAIEARAGAMMARVPEVINAAAQGNGSGVEEGLAAMVQVWDDVNAIFARMPERCDPYIYFHRVRPWIHGWKDNPALGEGLVYEGVTDTDGKPQSFRGQTGSQSSIVPTMDAFLNVGHANDPLRSFLDELHPYRPPAHQRFIHEVRARSRVREWVAKAGSPLHRDLYNACVDRLTRFRTQHLEYAASYIAKQSSRSAGNDVAVGTGGTPFMKYLKKHRDEARAHMLS